MLNPYRIVELFCVLGPSYPPVVEKYDMTHVLCSYHFMGQVPGCTIGMRRPLSQSFHSDVSALIYGNLYDEPTFEAALGTQLVKYAGHKPGKKHSISRITITFLNIIY